MCKRDGSRPGGGGNRERPRSWPRHGKGETDAATRQWTKPSVVLANGSRQPGGAALPQDQPNPKDGPNQR
ncbi:hypothetical protein, partial [Aeromonas salmonicida]|uniref:hypothetical protein n=1 Tax=Aeromonas salmonicida TaxID=645 RepID=UPI003D312DAC